MLDAQCGSEGPLPYPGPHLGESSPHLARPRSPAAVAPTSVPRSEWGELGSPTPGPLALTLLKKHKTLEIHVLYDGEKKYLMFP